MKLIVGLGNPGDKFINTRHNIGFEVVDALARKLGEGGKGKGESWEHREKFKAEIIKIDYNLKPTTYNLILAKPKTFMNLSGMAVSQIASYYKIKPDEIIVIHDELDLPLGHIKIRVGGSDAEKFVVEQFLPNEKSKVKAMIKRAVKAVEAILELGVKKAQSQYNDKGAG
ncbi:peptidyl-tRNA hydrolase [Candidatus Daviesbacteria bacterium]|nr:peptidyl-tRNA hydrolase [Candidatus Daviesbacteria bacterium]